MSARVQDNLMTWYVATISGKMYSKKDGKLLSIAEHNKAWVDVKANI